jgi:hypothetical protein
MTAAPAEARLRAIRLAHTAAWAFFAGCIVAIPVFAAREQFRTVAILTALVGVELAILAANRCSCPLTAVAARYTTDRRPNFDIYLPEWLARYNKQIFGTLLVLGLLYAWLRWSEAR